MYELLRKNWVILLCVFIFLASFTGGFAIASWRGSFREQQLSAKYQLDIERTNSDIAVLKTELERSQALSGRLGDGLRDAVEKAKRTTTYSGRARVLIDGIESALVELGVISK